MYKYLPESNKKLTFLCQFGAIYHFGYICWPPFITGPAILLAH